MNVAWNPTSYKIMLRALQCYYPFVVRKDERERIASMIDRIKELVEMAA